MKFVTRLGLGYAKREDIDLFIEDWHRLFEGSKSYPPLHEWLGMTEEEYGKWVEDDNYLDTFTKSR